MSQIHELYVRSEYWGEDHPVRWCIAATLVMTTAIWLLLRNLGYALMFSAFFNVGFAFARRTARGRQRWNRWAARHPRPGEPS
jgi:hypothetical protein